MEKKESMQIILLIHRVTHTFASNIPCVLFCSLFIISLFTLGCNKKLSNPESVDPIYKDLIQEKEKYEKLVEDIQKERKQALRKQPRLASRSLKKKLNQKTIQTLSKKLKFHTQKIKYFTIKAKHRLRHVRMAYEKAFRNKHPWPITEEYEHYLSRKKLQYAPRKWVQNSSSSLSRSSHGQSPDKKKSPPPAH